MRIRYYTVIIVLVFAMLISFAPINIFALGSNNEYSTLFDQATTLSPSTSSNFEHALQTAFLSDPLNFLTYLSYEDESTIMCVVYHWVSPLPIEQIYCIRAFVLEKSKVNRFDSILSMIDQQIGVKEYALSLEPYLNSVTTDDYSFSVPIIKRFIELNYSHDSQVYDEEFNHILATAFEASPSLFSEMINSYTQEHIELLAKCMASDYIKLGKTLPTISASKASLSQQSLIGLIQAEISSLQNMQISMQSRPYAYESNSSGSRSMCVPTIGTMTYTTAPLRVGESETLNVTFTENTQTGTQRQWYVEIYQVIGSNYTLKTAKTITIPAGSSSKTISFAISFGGNAEFYTHVKVYSSKGGTLLTSRTGTYPDTVKSYWKIYIVFPDGQDRSIPGTLYVYHANGTLHYQTECLGKSASNLPQNQINGDTPTGTYTGYLGSVQSDTNAYGPYKVIQMNGIAGNIADYSYRSGIWIHGGRSQTELQPTNGCVRVFNTAQLSLQNLITYLDSACGHEATGLIYITDE